MATKARTVRRAGKSRPLRQELYDLHLFISGATENSRLALANAKAIGEKHLKGRYRLSVIDVYQQPDRARGEEIIVVPTLVKKLPLPLRRMVGDLSNQERVLVGLDLVPRPVGKADKT